jgi:hypothetical protein
MMLCSRTILICLLLFIPLSGCRSDLAVAIEDGDTKGVYALLNQGVTKDDLNDALARAAGRARDLELVKVFLDKGADVNALNGMPLINATALQELKIVRFLLEKGADPNRGFMDGSGVVTPLHVSIVNGGNVEIVRLLLAHGAVTEIKDGKGRTPLKSAEQRGQIAVARLLRQAESKEMGLAQLPASPPQVAAGPTPTMPAIQSDVDRVPTVKTAAKKNAYAVVIGIEQYREKLPKADFADRDAKLVGEYLTKVLGYPEENVVVRTNDRATRTDLVKYFEEWLRNNVEKDSSVFVYYSGHGAPNTKTGEAYFVPYDGDPSFVDSTAYPVKQLYAALDKLPAKDITVVLDSCFSGAGGRSVLAKGARPMGLSMENATLASSRTVVLAASGGDQISNSFEEKGHGLLTYYFLKGLQGEGDGNKDGTIEMAELYDYVKPNVQRIARKQYNNEQTPQLLASPETLKKGGGRLIERARP